MPGDQRSRSCAECGQQVFDLSARTRRETQQLLHQSRGPLAAANCPVKITALDASKAGIPAKIRIATDGPSLPSNAYGVFETELAPGNYSLSVSSPGFRSQTLQLQVTARSRFFGWLRRR